MDRSQRAIDWLIAYVSQFPKASEDAIYNAMAAAGMPAFDADHAFKFTQIAWGRAFLSNAGVVFPADYYWLDANGAVIEHGAIANEPFFAYAWHLAPTYVGSPPFLRLALSSSDVQAVDNALKSRSKLENLRAAPPCLFTEAPTDAGMRAAQDLLRQILQRR